MIIRLEIDSIVSIRQMSFENFNLRSSVLTGFQNAKSQAVSFREEVHHLALNKNVSQSSREATGPGFARSIPMKKRPT